MGEKGKEMRNKAEFTTGMNASNASEGKGKSRSRERELTWIEINSRSNFSWLWFNGYLP